MAQPTPVDDLMRPIVVVLSFMLAAFIFLVMSLNLNQTDIRQLFIVLATSVVSGGLGSIIGFYVGSSKGSSDKDATIAAAAQKDGQ